MAAVRNECSTAELLPHTETELCHGFVPDDLIGPTTPARIAAYTPFPHPISSTRAPNRIPSLW